jgi:hypothetical protein
MVCGGRYTLQTVNVRAAMDICTATACMLLWVHHKLEQGVYRWDGRVAMRMRTVLLLNTIPVSQT